MYRYEGRLPYGKLRLRLWLCCGFGAALVLAGLTAEGHTTVTDVSHIERGYVDLAGKLNALGAQVVRQE